MNTPDLSPNAQRLLADAQAQLDRYPDSEVREVPADGDYDHRLVREGPLSAQVCTRLTEVRPPGTSHGWQTSDVAEVPCEDVPTHRHVILEC